MVLAMHHPNPTRNSARQGSYHAEWLGAPAIGRFPAACYIIGDALQSIGHADRIRIVCLNQKFVLIRVNSCQNLPANESCQIQPNRGKSCDRKPVRTTVYPKPQRRYWHGRGTSSEVPFVEALRVETTRAPIQATGGRLRIVRRFFVILVRLLFVMFQSARTVSELLIRHPVFWRAGKIPDAIRSV